MHPSCQTYGLIYSTSPDCRQVSLVVNAVFSALSKMASRKLIKNATVISMDPDLGILTDCDVLVEGREIVRVSQNIEVDGNLEVIDASDCIVSPGFVDGHHHMWQQLLRSVATDWTLADYMAIMRHIYGSLFTPEDVYIANLTASIDLIANGITTVIDHCHILNSPAHTDAAIKALKDSGIRGTFCYGFYENPPLKTQFSTHDTADPRFDTKAKMKDAQRAKEQHFSRNDPAEDLITFGIAPNEPEAWPMKAFIDEIEFARTIGARVITAHVAMGCYDLNKQVVRQLGDAKVLSRDLLFSHGSAFTAEEIELCSKHESGIVSTPETDLQMGMGYPVAFRAADKGCRVGLGLDISSNQNNDMFVQMRLLLQAERARADAVAQSINSTIVRKSEEALYFATLGGAKAVGLDHLVGSITPGKRADLVITRCDDINMVPAIDPVGMLLFNAVISNIDTVMVDGVILKRGGKLVGDVWDKIRGDVRERSARIVRVAREVSKTVQTKAMIGNFGKHKI